MKKTEAQKFREHFQQATVKQILKELRAEGRKSVKLVKKWFKDNPDRQICRLHFSEGHTRHVKRGRDVKRQIETIMKQEVARTEEVLNALVDKLNKVK